MEREVFISRLKTISDIADELARDYRENTPSSIERVRELEELLSDLEDAYNNEDIYLYDEDDVRFEYVKSKAEDWIYKCKQEFDF